MKKSNPISIDETQRQINRLLGIGDDVFLKYASGLHSSDPKERDQAQVAVDIFHKAGDQVFATYRDQPEKWSDIIDECQRQVNTLMGIDEATFKEYNKEQKGE